MSTYIVRFSDCIKVLVILKRVFHDKFIIRKIASMYVELSNSNFKEAIIEKQKTFRSVTRIRSKDSVSWHCSPAGGYYINTNNSYLRDELCYPSTYVARVLGGGRSALFWEDNRNNALNTMYHESLSEK